MSPDSKRSPSPEEKLLRLIRGKSAGPATGGTPSPAETVPARSLPTKVVRRAPRRRKALALPAWWLAGVNVVLGAVVLAGVGAIAWLVSQPVELPVAMPAPVVEEEPAGVTKVSEWEPAASVAAAASRPLFVAPSYSGSAAAPRGDEAPSVRANTLVQRLSLIGIVSGDPAQAIIEDAQTQKTYFVTAGQTVADGSVVESIRDNRVVLRLGTEHVELSL